MPALKFAGRGLPTLCQPLFEELLRCWSVVPDRDPLDSPESCGAVDNPPIIGKGHKDIVSELILLDDVSWMYGRSLLPPPSEDLIKPFVPGGLRPDAVRLIRRETSDALERDLWHSYDE